MKALLLFSCLAFFPTEIFLSPAAEGNAYFIEGIWFDIFDDTWLEIQYHRRGIKVREIRNGKRKKWRTYNDLGRGVYDDCDGRAIIVLSRNRLKWNQRRGGTSFLERGGSGRSDFFEYDSRYNYRGYGGRIRDFSGEWYCSNNGLSLSIEIYGSGFRARSTNNQWIYYERFGENDYRDPRGNRYYFDRNGLNWQDSRRRRTYCFTRR